MKPIRIVLAPTRSRPANIFLGIVLLLVSLLLFLALATYHATDPSLNTAVDTVTPHNWIGLFGAYVSDLLLQALGITAFLLPLWLSAVGWTWMRSRPGGSPVLRWMGTLLALTFLPAVLGLLPWHWRWLHVLPVEGVVGRLMSGLLVVYLNLQGAWVVAAALAAAGLYFASDISFGVIRENIADRWARFQEWRDRRRDLREEEDELEARRGVLLDEGNEANVFCSSMPQPIRRWRLKYPRRSRIASSPSSRAGVRLNRIPSTRFPRTNEPIGGRSLKSRRSTSVRMPWIPWLCRGVRASGSAAKQKPR